MGLPKKVAKEVHRCASLEGAGGPKSVRATAAAADQARLVDLELQLAQGAEAVGTGGQVFLERAHVRRLAAIGRVRAAVEVTQPAMTRSAAADAVTGGGPLVTCLPMADLLNAKLADLPALPAIGCGSTSNRKHPQTFSNNEINSFMEMTAMGGGSASVVKRRKLTT